jgi:alpha-N-arabinofuranosidase
VEPVAVLNAEKGELNVFVLNCDQEEDVRLTLSSEGNFRLVRHQALYGDDLTAINTFEQPDRVVMRDVPTDGSAAALLPRMSWSALTYRMD